MPFGGECLLTSKRVELIKSKASPTFQPAPKAFPCRWHGNEKGAKNEKLDMEDGA